MVWIQESVSLLIQEYKKRPILYDSKDRLYHHRPNKELAWLEVKNILLEQQPDCTVDQLKRKINGLRSHLAKELEKIEKSRKESQDDSKPIPRPSVWWFQRLLFLAPYVNATRRCDAGWMDQLMEQSRNQTLTVIPLPEPRSQDEDTYVDMEQIQCVPTKGVKRQYSTTASVREAAPAPSDCTIDDQYDIFGKFVASELREIAAPDIRHGVKHKITMTIFEGQETDQARMTQTIILNEA